MIKKLTWGYQLEEKQVKQKVLAAIRDPSNIIICPECGGLNKSRKYCGGCGSKFKVVTPEELRKIEAQYEGQNEVERNQISIEDLMK